MLHKLLNNLDKGNNESENSDNANDEASNRDSDTTLLVNTATCKNVSPVEIRKLASVPSKKKSPEKESKKKKILINETKIKRDKDSTEEITMDGKTYCLVNKATTHSLSKHARVYTNSLIDRRVNGGVAGEDTRVIFTNLDRRVSF